MFLFVLLEIISMVELKTELNPVRLVFGRDKSVELMVQVKNDSEKARMVSFDIVLSNHLSFEKNGMSNTRNILLGEMKPDEKVIRYFSIYPKMSLQKSPQPIYVTVMEHFEKKYDYILSKKSKELVLRIE